MGAFNPILHGAGDQIDPPWLIIACQSLVHVPNGLIFLDFVPLDIQKVLVRPFLDIVFENFEKFNVDSFFHR